MPLGAPGLAALVAVTSGRFWGFLPVPSAPLSFTPGMLIEGAGAEDSERHGLNAGFDGRFRHWREQRRMIGRQLRAGV